MKEKIVNMRSDIKKSASCLLVAFAAVAHPRPADAAVVINVTESGGNVVFNYSGTLDTTGLTPSQLGGYPVLTEVGPFNGYFLNNVNTQFDIYSGPINILPFGFGGFNATFGNATGDGFGIGVNGPNIVLPAGYNGGVFSGSGTITNSSFNSLGMNSGTYVNTLPNDTITFNIGTSSVPGPLPILGMPPVLLFTRKLKTRIKARRTASNLALA